MKKILFLSVAFFISLCVQSQNPTFFKNNKNLWGLKDKGGKVLLEPKFYNKPAAFTDGRSVFSKAGRYGVLDENGNEIVAPVYSSISDYKYGFKPG